MFQQLRLFICSYATKKNLSEPDVNSFLEEVTKQAKDYAPDVVGQCVSLWTSTKRLNNREFCSILNEVIRDDDRELVILSLPLIYGINAKCVTRNVRDIKWPESNILFRGAGTQKNSTKLNAFVPGKKYRCGMFLATSKKASVAKKFCRLAARDQEPVHYEIRLPVGGDRCVQVNYLENTNADGEEEFLFVPYSVFTVKSVDLSKQPTSDQPHRIVIEAAVDNVEEREDLPLIIWH